MSWWRAVKKKNNVAEILIFGEIGSSWWATVNTKQIREELADYDDVDEIVLRIDSPGGSVFAGIGLYSYLKDHKAKVKVYIDGMCASIATVIAMAGDEIYMNAGAQFMIHNPWTVAMGEAKELRQDAEVLEGLKESIINTYMTKCKLTKEELIKAMDKTTYYQANQALEVGFITEITHLVDAKNCENNAKGWDMSYEDYENRYKNLAPIPQNKDQNQGQEDLKNMKKEDIKNENPDVYNEILEEGRNAERERIKALDDLVDKVNDKGREILNKAKYENTESVDKIAMNLITQGGLLNIEPTNGETKNVKTEPNNIFNTKKSDAEILNNLGQQTGALSGDDALARDIAEYL